MRSELSILGFLYLSSQQYISIILYYGLFMTFPFIMLILIRGFGNILLPIMLGISDLIFLRLNAMSIWLFIFSAFIIFIAMTIDNGINCGWTFYVSLAFINSCSVDLLFFAIHCAGISFIIGSMNFIITIIARQSYNYLFNFYFLYFSLSLYIWAIIIIFLLLLLSLPVLVAVIILILLDRYYNACFLIPIFGGDVILFQHLFWFFGHPEVYILILPAFGLIIDIISRSSNIIIFGRDSMIIVIITIGFIGFLVWGHHMFNVGFDIDTRAYYSSLIVIIAIPTGIKIFNWVISIWSSLFYISISMCFIFGFLFSFSFGGLTGVLLSNCLLDILFHDSLFVVAHFHFVLSLGAVYFIFAAFFIYFHYFYSIIFIDIYAFLFFILFFISSNIIFFPLHNIGILGHSRRIFDYPILFSYFHYYSSIGFVGILLSITILLFIIIYYNIISIIYYYYLCILLYQLVYYFLLY